MHEYTGVFLSGLFPQYLDLGEGVMSIQVSETEALEVFPRAGSLSLVIYFAKFLEPSSVGFLFIFRFKCQKFTVIM